LHGLEQGRLGLRWGSVDLVGQKKPGEQRPLEEVEPAPARFGFFLDDSVPMMSEGMRSGVN
jgi:hypothetical protein